MAVKIGKALGTEVTVLSSSERKRNDAERLGGIDFALTSQSDTFTRLQRRFDFILDTISYRHPYAPTLGNKSPKKREKKP